MLNSVSTEIKTVESEHDNLTDTWTDYGGSRLDSVDRVTID